MCVAWMWLLASAGIRVFLHQDNCAPSPDPNDNCRVFVTNIDHHSGVGSVLEKQASGVTNRWWILSCSGISNNVMRSRVSRADISLPLDLDVPVVHALVSYLDPEREHALC